MVRGKQKQNIQFVQTVRMSVVLIVMVLVCIGFVVHFQRQEALIRDDRRIADLLQMQTVLSYHFELYGTYPIAGQFVCFDSLSDSLQSVVPWLVVLPQDPKKGNSPIRAEHACYNYQSKNGNEYKIRTVLEHNDFSMSHDGGRYDEWYELFTSNAQSW